MYALALLVLKWCVSGEQWTHQSSLNCKTQTQRAPEEERKKNSKIEERERDREMAWSATMIGALLGLGTQMYSNALRKLPYMRRKSLHSSSFSFPIHKKKKKTQTHKNQFWWKWFLLVDPWEHVVGMGLGVVFVNQLVKWDAQLAEDLDKMLEKAKAANERRYFGITMFSFWKIWIHFHVCA